MGDNNFDTSALERVGVGLLDDENLEVAVELERGLAEDLERSRATLLLLTNRRLIRYSVGGYKVSAVGMALTDVDTIEVKRTEKNLQWVWVGLVFIAGGVLLGLMSLLFLSSPISPLLMAISLTLIGIVFMLTYIGGLTGHVSVRAGLKAIKCKMSPKSLDAMAALIRRFYELKLEVAGQKTTSGNYSEPAAPRKNEVDGLTPTGRPAPEA